MSKKVKTIDGFSRPAKGQKRTVGVPAKGKNAKKITVTAAKKAKRAANEDFLAPVGTLDLTSEQIDRDIQKKKGKKVSKKAKKNKKPRKKWSKKRKIITGIIIFLILALIGAGIFAHWYLNRVSGGQIGLFDVFTAKDVELKKDANGRTNVLVLGTSGYDMGGSEHDGAQLTDSMMIISLDQEKKDVAMFSLPRDLLVGNTCTETGKVNEIYWCNNQDGTDEEAGATAAMEEVGAILGIDFQYYAHMNWGALVQVVDALGGVTVTLDEDIFDEWTNVYIDAGVPTELDGETALGLARARHGTYQGDFSRGASQQKILVAIEEKVMQEGLSLGQMMDLMGTLGDNVRMNFNADELKTIYNIVTSEEFSLENNVRQIALTDLEGELNLFMTDNIGGISYVVPVAGTYDYREIQKYLKQQLSSDAVTREGAEILVLNGTSELGAASAEEEALEEKGFFVADIDDAPEGACVAEYCVYDLTDGEKPATIKKLLKRYKLEEAYGEEDLPVQIYPGLYDIVVIIGESE